MTSSELTAEIETKAQPHRLAMLIDAENINVPPIIENLLDRVGRLGEVIVKRAYGDFTSQDRPAWKNKLQQFAIKAVQQFSCANGKNAADCRLIIDAMDLLYTKRLDGFCIVSSDSDFTCLAVRLREEGLKVYGFGEKKTPKALQNACHKFILTETLKPNGTQPLPQQQADNKILLPAPQPVIADAKKDKNLKKLLLEAMEKTTDKDGWVYISALGSSIRRIDPTFKTGEYGHGKLSTLLKNHQVCREIFTLKTEGSNVFYIQLTQPVLAMNPLKQMEFEQHMDDA